MRGNSSIDRETWKQFRIGLNLMLPWPVCAAVIQPLNHYENHDPTDYVIYLVGMLWTLIWDHVEKIQGALSSTGLNIFTVTLVAILVLMWLTVAALPLFGRWPKKQIIGLWAMQFSYAGSQAIGGYFYAKGFL